MALFTGLWDQPCQTACCSPTGLLPAWVWGFSLAAQAFPVPGQPALFLGTFWTRIPVIPGAVNAALNTNLLVLFARTFFFFQFIFLLSLV